MTGRRAFRALTTLILALATLAGGCASPDGGEPAPAQPAAPVTASPTSIPTVQEGQGEGGGGEAGSVPRELRFTAPALAGGEIRGADFAGKDLVIWFWAPW